MLTPVAHQIAIGLLDDIAEMSADAELDASLRRQAGLAGVRSRAVEGRRSGGGHRR